MISFYYSGENRDYIYENEGEFGLIHYMKEHQFYLKRVIGLPGDTVQIKDKQLVINGEKVDETYMTAHDQMHDFCLLQIQSRYGTGSDIKY